MSIGERDHAGSPGGVPRRRTVMRIGASSLLLASAPRGHSSAATLTVTTRATPAPGRCGRRSSTPIAARAATRSTFNIPGSGPYVITPLPPGLPADARSRRSWTGRRSPATPERRSSRSPTSPASGLKLQGGASTIRGIRRARHEHRHRDREQQQHRRGLLRRDGPHGHRRGRRMGPASKSSPVPTATRSAAPPPARGNLISGNTTGHRARQRPTTSSSGQPHRHDRRRTAALGNAEGILATPRPTSSSADRAPARAT